MATISALLTSPVPSQSAYTHSQNQCSPQFICPITVSTYGHNQCSPQFVIHQTSTLLKSNHCQHLPMATISALLSLSDVSASTRRKSAPFRVDRRVLTRSSVSLVARSTRADVSAKSRNTVDTRPVVIILVRLIHQKTECNKFKPCCCVQTLFPKIKVSGKFKSLGQWHG